MKSFSNLLMAVAHVWIKPTNMSIFGCILSIRSGIILKHTVKKHVECMVWYSLSNNNRQRYDIYKK